MVEEKPKKNVSEFGPVALSPRFFLPNSDHNFKMSRRVVSYSDISEAPPSLPSTSAGAEPSSNGGGSSKKRKNADTGQPRKRGRERRESSSQVHWDNPSYQSVSTGAGDGASEGYRAEFEAESGPAWADELEEGDDEADATASIGESEEQPYSEWKYDEWGEPFSHSYGGSYFDKDDNSQDDDEHYYEDEEASYSNSDSDELFPFAIPDVADFHRSHDTPSNPPHSSLSHPHRPPIEVGGGGRTLTHAEIWSSNTIIHAFGAAMEQYLSMHSPSPLPKTAQSALWEDAPRFDSLLATQIREDTIQILAQRHSSSLSSSSHIIGSSTGTNGAAAATGIGAAGGAAGAAGGGATGGAQGRGKPVVTVVPHGHLEGNSAWKKAVKTVEKNPNRIGTIEGAGDGKTVSTTSDKIGTTQGASRGKMEEEDMEKKLNEWWYAGYYAGVAAAKANGSQENGVEIEASKDERISEQAGEAEADVGADTGAEIGAEVGAEVGVEVGAEVGADVEAETGAAKDIDTHR